MLMTGFRIVLVSPMFHECNIKILVTDDCFDDNVINLNR